MSKQVDWNSLTEQYCEIVGCTDIKISEASSDNGRRKLRKHREEVLRAAKLVKETHEKYPDMSKEEFTKQVYKSLMGSILLFFILQALISVTLRMAIEWFINQLFS